VLGSAVENLGLGTNCDGLGHSDTEDGDFLTAAGAKPAQHG
jgi:hypothetical protein